MAAPRSPPDVTQLSAWMQARRYAEVAAACEELLTLQPASGELWRLQAAARLELGLDASESLARAVQLLPEDAQLHLHLGHALLDRGEARAAAERFRRLIVLKPRLAEAHDSLGLALMAEAQPAQAAASHLQALALDPRLASAHGNLGNALLELGEHARAVEHYRSMLALQPGVAEAHNNLGNALLALRRYEEAALSYREAVALRPDAPGALLNFGNALRESGRAREALAPCLRVLELKPDADAFRLLGHIQSDLGDLDRAIESYRRSLELEAGSVETLLGLGKILRRVGRIEEAETCCRQAVALAPNSGDALTLLGELQADHGRFGEAQGLFRRAIVAAPDQPEAWAALAQYRSMSDGDREWLAAVERILSGTLSPAQEINLRYALGKFFDDQRLFAPAFEQIQRANELERHTGSPFDRARLQLNVERIKHTYDAAWARAPRGSEIAAQRPVFVVGMPRSGTSLIEQILASHPAVFGAGELRYWNLAAARFEGSRTSGTTLLPPWLAAEYGQLLDQIAPAAQRIVDKMPANFMHLGLIHAALPGARLVHVRRHPLDTLLSIYFQAFSSTHTYAHDLADIAFYYRQYRLLMRHWHEVLGPDAILDIDYEALVRDPEPWTRRLIAHVGLPWDARCLSFHKTPRVVSTASNWQVRQKLNTRGIDRWRNYESHLAPFADLLEGADS